MTTSKFRPRGFWNVVCFNADGVKKWEENIKNITVDEGINDILDVYFDSGTQSTAWYIGLKGSNEVPAAGWGVASIGVSFTEATEYSQATRPAWTSAGASGKQITNSASPSEFSINNTATIYGAFLVSTNTIAGTTGILWCCSNFSAARSVVNGDTLKIVYTITGADA
jgi:hypothetical protein